MLTNDAPVPSPFVTPDPHPNATVDVPDFCSQHFQPGRVRTWLVEHILVALILKLLPGFKVVVAAPCIEQRRRWLLEQMVAAEMLRRANRPPVGQYN
jgi:hypothetical protein